MMNNHCRDRFKTWISQTTGGGILGEVVVADLYDAAQSELSALREAYVAAGEREHVLREELARKREALTDAECELTAAEQRNAELELKLHRLSDFARFVIKCVRRNGEYAPLSMQEPHEIEALLTQPTESGASE